MVAAFVIGCGLVLLEALARCGNAQQERLGGRALWVLAETQVAAETQEWVSDDAEPWRTDCKESNKRFSKQFQQLAAMQVQQAQTEQQLHEAREAATTATAAAAAAGK